MIINFDDLPGLSDGQIIVIPNPEAGTAPEQTATVGTQAAGSQGTSPSVPATP